jgi:choice-of-anchor B domain-containing protein
MKKLLPFLFAIILFANNFKAQTYPSLNISLLSHLNPETDNTGGDGRKYSGCWGWYQQSKNKEYALVGTSSKTYFIDVTNPSNPIICDSVKARRNGCTWREIKNYQNYCYIVSDDGSPNSFQIVDMQYLPDSVHVVHDGTTYFERCHTVYVDNDKLYCGGVSPFGSSAESMWVYSLANPAAPVLLRKLAQDIPSINYVHDMFVRNDTVYASAGWQGFYIARFNTATNTFSLMQSFTSYPSAGYNHSSWQTDDRKTMVFADEVPTGLPAKVIDVSDFSNIVITNTISPASTSTPHNPYIMGNKWCWMSTYQDGLYLYDISNPSNVSIYGYFDTHPQGGLNVGDYFSHDYRGNWGAYPYLPSKIIVALDMQNGIFILDGDATYKNGFGFTQVKEITPNYTGFSVYPNPAKNELNFLIANQNNQQVNYTIADALGKIVLENDIKVTSAFYKTAINTSQLADGCYFITLKGNDLNQTKKIIIQN